MDSLDAYKYLERFGYLGTSSGMSESLYNEEAVENAIRRLQRYGNINQTGVIDADTLKLMETPRCGVQDIDDSNNRRKKRFILGSSGWNKRNITYFIANWSPKIGEESVRKEMKKAFDIWAGYGNLRFLRSYNPEADIIIGFGSGYHGDYYPFDGRGNILAHAYYPYEMGAYGGDIHFDDDEQWTTGVDYNPDAGDVDFLSVAVHELGHSLGLAHSPVSDSVMFPFYRWSKEFVQLGYDDILAMHKLYTRVFEEPTTSYDDDYKEIQTEFPSTSTIPANFPEIETTELNNTTESTTILHMTTMTYDGDYETVEDHLKKHGEPKQDGPNVVETDSILCTGNIDAIALIRHELFVIKNEFLWRMRFLGQYSSEYPVKFHDFFIDLPSYVEKLDALYERPTDKAIILFSDNKYWTFNGHRIISGPNPLTDYGIHSDIQGIDAVQVWKKNGKTYIYNNNQFWRYDEDLKRMDYGYPKSMKRWRGVPSKLDAALTWTNGLTYFFKGQWVWRFNNNRVKVDEAFPQPSIHHWFGCPRNAGMQYL